MEINSKYGICAECGADLEPVWFEEEEIETMHGIMYKTGRKRRAVDYLICPICFARECVDNSFDEPWH
jgi:ribosomal protein L40E